RDAHQARSGGARAKDGPRAPSAARGTDSARTRGPSQIDLERAPLRAGDGAALGRDLCLQRIDVRREIRSLRLRICDTEVRVRAALLHRDFLRAGEERVVRELRL